MSDQVAYWPRPRAARPFSAMLRCAWRLPLIILALLTVALAMPLLTPWPRARRRAVECFCTSLCAILGLRIDVRGRPGAGPRLILANHVSWLDVCLLFRGDCPGFAPSFVAKSEVRGWPLIGGLAGLLRTCFIERGNAFACYRSLPDVQARIRSGPLVIFPEGTTTLGDDVAPFRAMLLEAAVREGVTVQPVLIAYRDQGGTASRAAAFIDDDSLVGSIGRLMREQSTRVTVHWLPELPAGDRRSLGTRGRQAIRGALLDVRTPPLC